MMIKTKYKLNKRQTKCSPRVFITRTTRLEALLLPCEVSLVVDRENEDGITTNKSSGRDVEYLLYLSSDLQS